MSLLPGAASGGEPSRARRGESAAERARRMLVQIVVGPSRATVLTVIGSVVVFLAVLAFGYLTRR